MTLNFTLYGPSAGDEPQIVAVLGSPGDAGADGNTILSGSGAPGGGTGADGDFYIDTAAVAIYGPKTGGVWGSSTALEGEDGAAGAVWRDGTGAPANGLGVNGDYYLDDATGNVYAKAAGSYSIVANIKGAAGSGTGDVVGPGSATDNAITRYDGATGKLVQSSGVLIDDSGNITPASNDASALGTSSVSWADLFFASGAVINFNASNVVLTHSSGVLTLGTGDLRISTAGTNSASVVTVGGTQTLTAKSLTTPVLTGTASGTTAGALGYNGGIFSYGDGSNQRTVANTNEAQSFSNKTLTGTKETTFTITDAAAFEVDPANGGIQTVTLGANRTPKGTNFAAGHSVLLMVDDGTARTLTWTDATWGGSGVVWRGGSAPTLATSGFTCVELWKLGSQVYGAHVGNV